VIRILSLCCCIFCLQGCFPISFYKTAYQTSINQRNSSALEITPVIRDLPFAMQSLQHKNNNVLLVLAYDDKGKLSFMDSESQVFTFYHGKIIGTNNLENNLLIKDPANIQSIFFNLSNNQDTHIKHESFIRYTNPMTSFLTMKSSYKLLPQKNKLFQRKLDQAKINYFILEEKFEVPSFHWKGSNYYWLSIDGNILKSKQYIFPDKPKYFFETLKLYKG